MTFFSAALSCSGWAATVFDLGINTLREIGEARLCGNDGSIISINDELRAINRLCQVISIKLNYITCNYVPSAHAQTLFMDVMDTLFEASILVDEISTSRSIASNDLRVEASKTGYLATQSMLDKFVESAKLFFLSTGPKLEHCKEKLVNLSFELNSIRFEDVLVGASSNDFGPGDFYGESKPLLGRDVEQEKIIHILTETSRPIISIVGMTGVGKTTLAQHAYNHPLVRDHFNRRIWVTTREEFSVERLTQSILSFFMMENRQERNLDLNQRELHDFFNGTGKLLVVLDGVWHENRTDWDMFLAPFRGIINEIKILLTTQSPVVASVIGSTHSFDLDELPFEHCQSIFKKHAFGDHIPTDSKIVETGDKIVNKSFGIPLVAKTLGNLLSSKLELSEWEFVLDCELLHLPVDGNSLLPALWLSYLHLPTYLKPCISYFAIFPQNHIFDRNDLILLWMAEGYIKPKGRIRMEEVGDSYFSELVDRLFLTEIDHQGQFGETHAGYKMKPMFYEMAQLAFGNECFRVVVDEVEKPDPFLPNLVRYSSLCTDRVEISYLESYTNLRSFLLLQEYIKPFNDEMFNTFKYIRVLNISGSQIKTLTVGNLRLLRYLNASSTPIEFFDFQFCNLYNLQTLKLKNCPKLLYLPTDLGKLVNLRHLDIDENLIRELPPFLGTLVNLQKLQRYVVSKRNGYKITELKGLDNLRGTLCISGLEHVEHNVGDNKFTLSGKRYFHKLELVWSMRQRNDIPEDKDVLESLQPHPNLKELIITRYSHVVLPSWDWKNSSLSLENIILDSCRLQSIAPLGELPLLKNLLVVHHQLNVMDRQLFENSHGHGFRKLESLTIEDCNLTKWSGMQMGDLPRLINLSINNCPNLVAVPRSHIFGQLRVIEVASCASLKSFTDIDLPALLERLIIMNCPLLKNKCEAVNTKEWILTKGFAGLEIIEDVL